MANSQVSNIPDPNVGTRELSDAVSFPVKALAVIVQGDYVCFDTGGYLIPAGDTASAVFAGQAVQSVTGTAADGGVSCNITPIANLRVNQWILANAVSPAIATWVGRLVYFSGPKTVALAATTSHDVCAGTCTQVNNTTATGSVSIDCGQNFPAPN